MALAVGNAEFLIAVFASLFLIWFLYRWSLFNLRSFPPGPIGFPLLGYLGLLFDYPDKVLVELSKKYGKIFSLYCGPQYTVVTTDYEIAKEIISHPASLARPPDVFGFIPGEGGICGVNGAEWLEQRRFCVSSMRNLGMGKGVWENMIQASVKEFVDGLGNWKGKPKNVSEFLTISLSSVNTSLLIGRMISKKLRYEIELVKDAHVLLSQHFNSSSLSALVPWLPDYLVRFRIGGYHKRRERLDEFADMFRKEIEERMKSSNEGYTDDFIGIYLSEKEKQEASGKHHYFSVQNLVGNLIVLFFAGSDTSTASLHWLIKLMAVYPEVQKKVQEELDEVIGSDGQVRWEERKRLPYSMAVILEMERYITINRIFPPRISTAAFECNGYIVPKGSRIFVNSWAVMHDPKYWKDPMEFIPERFMQNDGKDPSKMEGISTFSFGRRNCPGETVAMMTIFIYFTGIMQKFQIKAPFGILPTLDVSSYGVVVNPVGEELCFVER